MRTTFKFCIFTALMLETLTACAANYDACDLSSFTQTEGGWARETGSGISTYFDFVTSERYLDDGIPISQEILIPLARDAALTDFRRIYALKVPPPSANADLLVKDMESFQQRCAGETRFAFTVPASAFKWSLPTKVEPDSPVMAPIRELMEETQAP